jgi:methanol--5-hydroxybenzimidazolylcobamide Co-methyltransferase
MRAFHSLAIADVDQFCFGISPNPLTLPNGMIIGGGVVYPELNFTLPPMSIDAESMPEVREQYRQMIESACARAVELYAPGLVVEFELLPELTRVPEWGAEITALLADTLRRYVDAHGLKGALRVTPNRSACLAAAIWCFYGT